jgi:hypothetical protein
MEDDRSTPTSDQAPALLPGAEAGPASPAVHLVAPRLFFLPVGAAVAIQIGTTAAGLAGVGESPLWMVAAGFAVFLAVAAVQLARARRGNGICLGGLASRVIGGTAAAASTSYVLALAAAVWAAFAGAWWLLTLCAAAGGAAYALSGMWWVRRHGSGPTTRGREASSVWTAVSVVLSSAGLILLVSLQ